MPAKLVTVGSGIALILSGLMVAAVGLPHMISAALLAIGLAGLHYRHEGSAGLLGWAGLAIALAGALLYVDAGLADRLFAVWFSPSTVPAASLLLPGFILWLGILLLGTAMIRAGVFPRRNALFLMLGAFLALTTGSLGAILFGTSLSWLGYQQITGKDITGRPLWPDGSSQERK